MCLRFILFFNFQNEERLRFKREKSVARYHKESNHNFVLLLGGRGKHQIFSFDIIYERAPKDEQVVKKRM